MILKKVNVMLKLIPWQLTTWLLSHLLAVIKKNIEEKKSLGPVESDKNILNP